MRKFNDADVSRLDVGVMIDKLGIRVADCQLGCFKVSKTDHVGEVAEAVDNTRMAFTRSSQSGFPPRVAVWCARQKYCRNSPPAGLTLGPALE